MLKFSAVVLFALMPFFGRSQQSIALPYKIYDTKNQRLVSPDDIISSMDHADVLFFGEEHNDSTGHMLEFTLFSKLTVRYPGKVGLSMEMFETDCQNVLNEYLNGLIREKNFVTEARAWHNYKDYRPMIELAKTLHTPVVAANAPARYVNMVNRLGLNSLQHLGAAGKAWLPPLPVDTAAGAYYDNFVKVMGGHSGMGGMQVYQAQNLWDATMGWSVGRFFKKHQDYKILQINGGFHSQDKLGAAAMLKKYEPRAKMLNIACYSDDSFDHPDWSKYSRNDDYIILTDPALAKTF